MSRLTNRATQLASDSVFVSSAIFACFIISIALTAGVVAYWRSEALRHDRLLDRLALRIHVNGIRGKSSVTRLIAGILCEAGICTLSKTTGTAAVVITPDLGEEAIARRAAPSVLEQIRLLDRYIDDSTQAIVIECMAVRPSYQIICEEKVIRAHIGVITNVREDHQEQMGTTLPEIARSLLGTCPRGGVLVTAERDREILDIMRGETARRGSQLVVADPHNVPDKYLRRFPYVEFKENIAIGLAIARQLGIGRETALRGMLRAPADPGVLRVREFRLRDKRVTWVNLFAANDRQSVTTVVEQLNQRCTSDTTMVAVLNNRADRADRAMAFADVVARDLTFDRVALLGAYEQSVYRRLIDQGFPASEIIRLGEQRELAVEEIVQRVVDESPKDHVMLVGLVNVHTRQAETLMRYLDACAASEFSDSRPAIVGCKELCR